MDFYAVIERRRSNRSYKADAIPEKVLHRVMDAARIAPSGSNRQPWRFILVKDPALREALVPLMQGQQFVAEAPIIVVACGSNIRYNRGGYMGDYSVLVDVAIAVDHLTLAACAEGLGTCWIGSFDNEGVKQLLGIPEEANVVALTPLGFPNEAFGGPKSRKPVEEIICTDRWA